MPFCNKCGKEFNPPQAFCATCGSDLRKQLDQKIDPAIVWERNRDLIREKIRSKQIRNPQSMEMAQQAVKMRAQELFWMQIPKAILDATVIELRQMLHGRSGTNMDDSLTGLSTLVMIAKIRYIEGCVVKINKAGQNKIKATNGELLNLSDYILMNFIKSMPEIQLELWKEILKGL